jgi:hypothetical protein
MSRVLANIVEIFVYATVYLFIAMIAIKLVAASLLQELEKRSSENSLGPSLVIAGLLVGLGLVVSTVVR